MAADRMTSTSAPDPLDLVAEDPGDVVVLYREPSRLWPLILVGAWVVPPTGFLATRAYLSYRRARPGDLAAARAHLARASTGRGIR